MLLGLAVPSFVAILVDKPPLDGRVVILHLLLDFESPFAILGDWRRWWRWIVVGGLEWHAPRAVPATLLNVAIVGLLELVHTAIASNVGRTELPHATLLSAVIGDLPGIGVEIVVDLPAHPAHLRATDRRLRDGK